MALKNPGFSDCDPGEKTRMRENIRELPKLASPQDTRYRSTHEATLKLLINQGPLEKLQDPGHTDHKLMGKVSFPYLAAQNEFLSVFIKAIDYFESDHEMNNGEIVMMYEFLMMFCCDLEKEPRTAYGFYLNALKRGGIAALSGNEFDFICIFA